VGKHTDSRLVMPSISTSTARKVELQAGPPH
jgi:hypothetical protein